MTLWCNYHSTIGGQCGRVAQEADRCRKHIGKEEVKKTKGKKFSGSSSWREDNGYFQAREK